MAYYCSRDCQREAWTNEGHKQCCRKPNQILPGDFMLLTGLQRRLDWNGHIVRVNEEDPEKAR